ncbi:cytochrome P450 [Nemania sp. FL0031]|nr:cytochrome P450 [Nemania sp. FL0031]
MIHWHFGLNVGWVVTSAAVLVGLLTSTYIFLWALMVITQDGREPPLALTSLPFISPVIKMKKWKGRFYTHMKKRNRQPIYTLRVANTRLYIINTTSLIPAVQRHYKTLSFDPIQIQGMKNILGVSRDAIRITGNDVMAGNEDTFLSGMIKAIHPSLTPGKALDAMNCDAIRNLEPSLASLAAKSQTIFQLYDFVRKTIMAATMQSTFGPLNPMQDSAVVESWLKFEAKIPILSLGILPNLFAKDGIQAREVLVKAFIQYLEARGQDQASGYIQNRISFFSERGIPADDIARFEVGGLIALNTNTIPAAFWIVYHIFSDPNVLADCRDEVSAAVQNSNGGNYVLNFEHIKNSCPILHSTFWEVFRVHGIGLVPRRVLEDHMLDNRYLLKKDSTIFIPYRVQHHDPDNWGADHAEFHHKRFVKQPGTKRYNPAAFRGFGNGAHLCPGRHFASAEILSFVAMLLYRFDIRATGGKWPELSVERSSQVSALDQPDHDFEIEVRPRDGVSTAQWSVIFPGSEQPMEMIG